MVTSQEHQEVLDKFRNYKRAAMIGYVILLIGVGIAVHGNASAIHKANHALSEGRQRSKVVRGVLCKQLSEKDINLYKFIKENPPGTTGLSALLTPKIVQQSLHNTARERREIGYAPTPAECNPNITPPPPAK